MNSVWNKSGNFFRLSSGSREVSKLEPGIYIIGHDLSGFYLEKRMEKFEFPYKIYGSQKDFVKRVVRSYKTFSGNLGVLLNGIKGTGKTVTAEQIANESKLPVLIVSHAFEGLPEFINSINQDIALFFDEFEKMYNDYDSSILTVMDGVLNNGYKRLFLLTTNQIHINDNMISRPGRIRYLKTFGDLEADVVKEIVDDLLERKEYREECIKFIATLEIITIDIVKSLISEVNLYNEPPEAFKDIFNVKKSVKTYNVSVKDSQGKTKLVASNAKIHPKYFDEDCLGSGFIINGEWKGDIVEIQDEGQIEVRYDGKTKTYILESNVKIHRNFSNVF